MKSKLLTFILILFYSYNAIACSCECDGDCSFSAISENAEFLALVKVVSFDDYLDHEILGHEGKMPYSMTVEVIQKYKGEESRKRIKIWGDDGAQCRPYIANFKIGEYYLIAPNKLGEYRLENENIGDYDFFSCNTDYLKVDMDSKKAFGTYTKKRNEIDLKEFEKQFNQ